MAYASDIRTSSFGTLGAALHRTAESIRKAYRQHRAYRQTFDELSSLSTRELNDLGIGPCQIRFIAREAAKMVE